MGTGRAFWLAHEDWDPMTSEVVPAEAALQQRVIYEIWGKRPGKAQLWAPCHKLLASRLTKTRIAVFQKPSFLWPLFSNSPFWLKITIKAQVTSVSQGLGLFATLQEGSWISRRLVERTYGQD